MKCKCPCHRMRIKDCNLCICKEAEKGISYEELKRRLDESCKQEDTRAWAIAQKREEIEAVRAAGGGHAIARRVLQNLDGKRVQQKASSGAGEKGMATDTDFNFGFSGGPSTGKEIDERITEQYSSRCMYKVICTGCGKYYGYCAEITEEKEKIKMLPTGERDSGNQNNRGGLNWLKVDYLDSMPKEAKILMVRFNEQGRFGPRVELKLAFNGDTSYLGVIPNKKKDPRYKVLIDNFGPDENTWIDKRIHLSAERNEFTNSFQMKISVPEQVPAKRKEAK